MNLEGVRIGFALTGSFCTFEVVIHEMEGLIAEGAEIVPIISNNVSRCDTRFGSAAEWKEKIKLITGKNPIASIVEAEPIGPQALFDVLVIAPCTGNTLAKIANAITDTPATMAVKAHLRNKRPLVLAISTNDGLAANAKNLGLLLNTKNVYFVPFIQDDPLKKSTSLVAKFELLMPTIQQAMEGKQLQPLLGK